MDRKKQFFVKNAGTRRHIPLITRGLWLFVPSYSHITFGWLPYSPDLL